MTMTRPGLKILIKLNHLDHPTLHVCIRHESHSLLSTHLQYVIRVMYGVPKSVKISTHKRVEQFADHTIIHLPIT